MIDRKPIIFQWRYLIQTNPQTVIQTDTSLEGWGAKCIGIETDGKWSVEKKKLHINILELLAVKNGILAFKKMRAINVICIQIVSATSFLYLLKMGVTIDKKLVELSKDT